jgi:hypothetical protein
MHAATPFARVNSWLVTEYSAFERTLHKRASKGALVVAAGSGAIAFLILLAAVPRGLAPGDAPFYADQIATVDLANRTVHVGYYMLGIAFTRLVPIELDYALNIMSAVFGALAVSVVSLLAYTLTGRLSASIAAACTLAGLSAFIENAVWAEVYAPHLFFFLLCVLLALWDAPVLSGLSFAAAFLMTPSTVLALPLVVLLRPQRKFLLLFGVAAAVPLIAVLAPRWKDFLYGGRGLILVSRAHLGVLAALSKEGREVWTFYLALPLIAIGLYTLASSGRHRLLLAGIFSLWALQLFFGEGIADFAVQLPLYGLLAVLAGVGFARVLHIAQASTPVAVTAWALLVVALVIAGVYNYSGPYKLRPVLNSHRQGVLAMREEADDRDVVLVPYPVAGLLEHDLRATPPLDIVTYEALQEGPDQHADNEARKSLERAFTNGKRVWLLSAYAEGLDSFFAPRGYALSPRGMFVVASRVRQ